jgi:hypothetical protein
VAFAAAPAPQTAAPGTEAARAADDGPQGDVDDAQQADDENEGGDVDDGDETEDVEADEAEEDGGSDD